MGSLDSLKTKADFDLVYRHGFYRYGKNFVLYALCQDSKSIDRDLPQILLGLSVSRKVGSAPARNLLKRRVRMICRESIAHALFSGFSAAWSSRHSGVAPKLQLVFVAKAGIAAISLASLGSRLKGHLLLSCAIYTPTKAPEVFSLELQTRRRLSAQPGLDMVVDLMRASIWK